MFGSIVTPPLSSVLPLVNAAAMYLSLTSPAYVVVKLVAIFICF